MFRHLLSRNGQGLVEPDTNSGALRDISPNTNGGVTTKLITSEDLMRGVMLTTSASCTYTLVGCEELLNDFPDWQIGASVSLFILRGGIATTISVTPSGAIPMVPIVTNGGSLLAMSRLIIVVRYSTTEWRFYCLGI